MSQFVWNITKKQKEIYNETIDNGRVTKTYVAEILKQAFIQALLSTVAFRQRFSFFTACLVNYLDEVLPWWATKEKFLKFSSPYCWEIHFQHSFWLEKHSLHIVCL